MSEVFIDFQAPCMQIADGDTGIFSWGESSVLTLDIDVTDGQGANQTLEVLLERLLPDRASFEQLYTTYTLAIDSYPKHAVISLRKHADDLGTFGRVRWVLGGATIPGFVFSIVVRGDVIH